jgi:predicted anti-sigma-YlaC factor YlaD
MNNPLLTSEEADSVSKHLFESAVKASNGKDMGPYITYAESVSKTRQNRDEFVYLLNEALKIGTKSAKEFQLTNTISKNRAEWLLDNIDEFFY